MTNENGENRSINFPQILNLSPSLLEYNLHLWFNFPGTFLHHPGLLEQVHTLQNLLRGEHYLCELVHPSEGECAYLYGLCCKCKYNIFNMLYMHICKHIYMLYICIYVNKCICVNA
jgi:hypothetical protein